MGQTTTQLWKYPKTPHLSFSPGKASDDITLSTHHNLEGKEVVLTTKKDGENTTLYPDYYHARSTTSTYHPSQSWLKAFHASIKHKIPEGYRLCGENLYAVHSIRYINLESYFLLFSVWEGSTCLSWDNTLWIAKELGLITVPVLWKSPFLFNESVIKNLAKELDTTVEEGFVVRTTESFEYAHFDKHVAKWVRPNHVQTDEHWKSKTVEKNLLA